MAESSYLLGDKLLSNLSDDEFFTKFVTHSLSNSIILELDKVVTEKPMTYTQKQQLANLRDEGILNEIMLGNFDKISITKLVEIFSIFNLGLNIVTIPKEELSRVNIMEKH